MSAIPEGAQTVFGEGRDLQSAIAECAQALGVESGRVRYKLDMSHFRGSGGRPVPRTTVRIEGWAAAEGEVEESRPARTESAEPRGERRDGDRGGRDRGGRDRGPRDGDRGGRDRGGRDRGPRDGDRGGRDRDHGGRDLDSALAPRAESADRPAPPVASIDEAVAMDRDEDQGSRGDGLRGAEAGPTEASGFAEGWFLALLKLMDVEGTITGTGSAERVHLHVKADKAGRIIGKRGSTLGAIRHLLRLALQKDHGDLIIDVDVADDRPRDRAPDAPPRDGGRDRGPRDGDRGGDRGERGARDRGDRPRGRDRGPRDGDRGGDRPRGDRGDRGGDRGDRGGDRGGDRDKGRYPEAKLQELARRAAEKAIETGRTITIKLDLNSYDRRIVHLAIADIDGVASRSEEKDGQKFVQVIPEGAAT